MWGPHLCWFSVRLDSHPLYIYVYLFLISRTFQTQLYRQIRHSPSGYTNSWIAGGRWLWKVWGGLFWKGDWFFCSPVCPWWLLLSVLCYFKITTYMLKAFRGWLLYYSRSRLCEYFCKFFFLTWPQKGGGLCLPCSGLHTSLKGFISPEFQREWRITAVGAVWGHL